MQVLKYKIIESPVGLLKIVAEDEFLVAILWDNDSDKPNRVKLSEMIKDNENPVLLEVERQLGEYFLRKRTVFDIAYKMYGTTFQKSVWNLLSQIPYGTKLSYQDLAIQLNNPKAVRAVGSANGRNPISIIVPCHRVIASNGKLAGFAGGLDKKKILLDLEVL